MLKLWGKMIKNNKIILQEVSTAEDEDYQMELKKCITDISYKMDIQKPYWLPKNLEEYNRVKRTTFDQDNFIEEIEFDRLEIIVLEEK